ncbi:MAG TPA: sigma-70 family RNA polymerase sigma factor [Thermoanaerobaculia bacterium]|nr:sigma-70 family RNA polymerase sigma factor [Thermoanaerobaculia bacterium]
MRKRILVVDDETAIVEGVSLLLDFEDIENAAATDRDGAVSILSEMFFPVVITDLCLRTVDEGLGLIDDVMRLSPNTKVMVLSGYVDAKIEDELMQRGVSAVIHKPAPSDEFLAAVHELLEEIEEEAQKSDRDLEQLYLTARRKLMSIPQKRFGLSPDRAEDVLQEAWLLFLEKRGFIRSATAWLAGAVVNLSRQHLDQCTRRRESLEPDETLELLLDDANDPRDTIAVRQALASIDDRARTLCALIGMEGLSYDEVSELTGMPLGSIGPLYIRAKKKLKQALEH